jgi:hypothetical protein
MPAPTHDERAAGAMRSVEHRLDNAELRVTPADDPRVHVHEGDHLTVLRPRDEWIGQLNYVASARPSG